MGDEQQQGQPATHDQQGAGQPDVSGAPVEGRKFKDGEDPNAPVEGRKFKDGE